jgi:hypothetical protein
MQNSKSAHENRLSLQLPPSPFPLKEILSKQLLLSALFQNRIGKKSPKKPHNSREKDHSQLARKKHTRISRRIWHVILWKNSFSPRIRNLHQTGRMQDRQILFSRKPHNPRRIAHYLIAQNQKSVDESCFPASPADFFNFIAETIPQDQNTNHETRKKSTS